MEDEKGQTPLPHLTKDKEMIKLLLKHGARVDNVYKQYSSLLGELASEQPPENAISIFFTGDAKAGKSTLLKALLSSKGFRANFLKAKPVADVDKRTVGIIPYQLVTKEFGRVNFYDFAGPREFHYSSHCAILKNAVQTSPPIIIHLVHLLASEQKIADSIAWWMTLVQNQCTNLTSKAHVIIVGSHADKLKESGKKYQDKANTFAPIFEKFSNLKFTVFIPIDCRFPDSDQMKSIKKQVQKSSAIFRSLETVSLNAHLFYIYLCDNYSAISMKNILKQILRDLKENPTKSTKNCLSFIPSTLPRLVEICDQLNKKGLILYLHNEDSPERSFIICDCATLLSKVTDTVFASDGFHQQYDLASSTGVVPLSKFSDAFDGYDTKMILMFMLHIELCFEIKDKVVLELIGKHALTSLPNEPYFYFPGLIRINAPEEVWEEDSTISCHFGLIMTYSQEIQFLDPRYLLILRLVFTFGVISDGTMQKHNPSLQCLCSIWKNGISWGNDDEANSHFEQFNNGKSFVLKMRSRVLKPEFISIRSKILAKVRETVRDICPNITTLEYVIDPQEVIRHPLIPETDLTLFNMSDIAKAVFFNRKNVESQGCITNVSQLLQFEPYAGLSYNTLQYVHSEKNAEKGHKISNAFISHFTNQVADSEHINTYIKIFSHHSNGAQASQSDSLKQQLVHTMKIWRDETEGTYICLRKTLNKYSIFAGRNLLVRLLQLHTYY